MAANAGRPPQPDPRPGPLREHQPAESWIGRLSRLQNLLEVCPADIVTRYELATLLEEMGLHEEAWFNWKAVLACDPNNLRAREGMARCRHRAGRPLHTDM